MKADLAAALHARDIEVAELRSELSRVRAERDALEMQRVLVPFDGRMVSPIAEAELCRLLGITAKVARQQLTSYSVGDSRAKVYDLVEVLRVCFARDTRSGVHRRRKLRNFVSSAGTR